MRANCPVVGAARVNPVTDNNMTDKEGTRSPGQERDMSMTDKEGTTVLTEPTRETWVETCEWTGRQRDRDRYTGIWLRYDAALTSLLNRAHLGLKVYGWGRPEACSQYGDTDQVLRVSLGSPLEDFSSQVAWGRVARFVGTLTLHRTVGRNAEWRLEGVVCVRSSLKPEEVTTFALQPEEGAALCERAVRELAASAVRELAAQAAEAAAS
jgi:hypothetical protein